MKTQNKEPDFDYDDNEGEDEIFGYECLGCGHIQDFPGECDMCCGNAVDPIYF